MADEPKAPEPAPEEAPAEKRGLSGKAMFVLRLFVGILTVLLLIAVSAAVAWHIAGQSRGDSTRAGEREDEPTEQTDITYDFLDVGDPFVTLPTDENGLASASMRVTIRVGIRSDRTSDKLQTVEAFNRRKEVIRDQIITVLLGVRPSEFRKNQAQQKANLQASILAAINQQMPRDHGVDLVIFSDFVFQ